MRALPLQKQMTKAHDKQAEKEKAKHTADEKATLAADSDSDDGSLTEKGRQARQILKNGSSKGSSRGSGARKPLKATSIPAFNSDDEAEVGQR